MYINNYSVSRSGHNFVGSMIKSWLPNQVVNFNSYENILISEVKENNCKPGLKLLVIRSFLNWAASYHMMICDLTDKNEKAYYQTFKNMVNVYYELLNEYQLDNYYFADIKVYYDKFIKSKRYRKQICKKLKGKYSNKLLNFVSSAGKYSSFDGDRYQGRGSKMKTDTRYLQVKKYKDYFYTILRENKGLIELSFLILGTDKKQLEFFNKICNV